MENRRFVLICAMGVLLFLIWQAWQKEQAAQQPRAAIEAAEATASENPSLPEPPAAQASDDPAVAPEEALPPPPAARSAAAPAEIEQSAADGFVTVRTDVIEARISLRGGDLRQLRLLEYPESIARPDPLPLLDDSTAKWSVVQSGILAPQGHPATQNSRYQAEQSEHRLADGEDRLQVVLRTRDARGVTVDKRYTFHRGRYLIDLEHSIDNGSDEALDASAFIQLWRQDHILGDQPPFAPTFTGYGFYEARDGGSKYRFEKIAFDAVDDEAMQVQQPGGWLSMMQHYFIIAAIPPQDQQLSFAAKPARSKGYLGQITTEAVRIPPGSQATVSAELFVGPKLQKRLDDIAPGFDLTIDYGILTPLSAPLFWVLDRIHRLLGNWGWAIVVLTLLVKGAMYKLSEAQFRSFGKMRHFAPRIQELRERYGDDRQRLNQAMMDLYKKEGFNPLGGCLPMLVQFPVFIALYWVLLESVELRQAPFIGWIADLSVPDPYYILPLFFGASMWLQQRLSGQMATMEPMQQRIMLAMPILLTAFFTLFPAGLVLYWFVSNLVSIAQQTYINRKLDAEAAAKKAKR